MKQPGKKPFSFTYETPWGMHYFSTTCLMASLVLCYLSFMLKMTVLLTWALPIMLMYGGLELSIGLVLLFFCKRSQLKKQWNSNSTLGGLLKHGLSAEKSAWISLR
jgi:hypothetical protein